MTDDLTDLTVVAASRQLQEIADRAHVALRERGKMKDVLRHARVSESTLSRVLRAQQVKRRSLLDVADALGVPSQWLIDGEGEYDPAWILPVPLGPRPDGTEVVAGPVMPLESPGNKDRSAHGLFGTVDLTRLATALEGAQKAFHDRGITPSSHRLVQVMLLLYDEATQQATNRSES